MNPDFLIQQMINNSQIAKNPIGKNALEMYRKGDRQGLNELANNLCREHGTSIEEMTQKIKSQFGL